MDGPDKPVVRAIRGEIAEDVWHVCHNPDYAGYEGEGSAECPNGATIRDPEKGRDLMLDDYATDEDDCDLTCIDHYRTSKMMVVETRWSFHTTLCCNS